MLKRMESLEDAIGAIVRACGEIAAADVSDEFKRAYSAAQNALSGHDWIDGTFVPRFGTCPLPMNRDNHTATACIRDGNCTCDEKEMRP